MKAANQDLSGQTRRAPGIRRSPIVLLVALVLGALVTAAFHRQWWPVILAGSVLVALGCRTGQGYLFARPLPAADLESLMTTPSTSR
jgi:hypothetical protein